MAGPLRMLSLVAGCLKDETALVPTDTGGTPESETAVIETETEALSVFLVEVTGEEAVTWVRVLGDSNGDGRAEVVARSASSDGDVLLADVSGVTGRLYDLNEAAPTGDTTGDGLADLAVAVDGQLGVVPGPLTMSAPARDAATWIPLPPDASVWKLSDGFGDVDGDGTMDVVHGTISSSESEDLAVNGVILPDAEGWGAEAIAVLPDVAGVGRSDILIRTYVGSSSLVRVPLTGWPVDYPVALDQVIGGPRAIGDVDGDGTADLVLETSHGRWDGFVAVTSLGGVVEPPDASLAGADADGGADVDGDGIGDLVVSWTQDGLVRVGLAFGPVAGFSDVEVAVVGPDDLPLTGAVALGDLDGDDHADVVLGTAGGLVVVSGAWLVATRPPVLDPPVDEAWDPCEGSTAGPRDLAGAARAPLVGAWSTDSAPVSFVGDDGPVTDLEFADVDGDGVSDLVAASPFWQGSDDDVSGAVFVIREPRVGSQSLLAGDALTGGGGNSAFGYTVATGDADGDGRADLLATAIGEYIDGYFDGVYLLSGGIDGVECVEEGARYVERGEGFVAATLLSDQGTDGVAEVVTTDTRHSVSFLASPHPAGGERRDFWLEVRPSDGYDLGFVLADAGDTDGDGLAELAVDESWVNKSRVHLVDPSFSGVVTIDDVATVTWTGGLSDELGRAMAAAGDVDGDGRADLLVGEPKAEGSAEAWQAGRAHLLTGGSASGEAVDVAYWTVIGAVASGGLGYAVAAGGDTDGDGSLEILVGGDGLAGGLLFEDPPSGTGTPEDAVATFSGGVGAEFAFADAVAFGDLDGDGFDDVALAGDSVSELGRRVGSVWVFFGAP